MNAVKIFAACKASATDVLQNTPLPPRLFLFSTDSLHGLTDGVFIFEAVSTEDSKTMQGYDAIVVEQWTVLEVSAGLAGAFCCCCSDGDCFIHLQDLPVAAVWLWLSSERQLDLGRSHKDPIGPFMPLIFQPSVGEWAPCIPFCRKNTLCQTLWYKRFFFH